MTKLEMIIAGLAIVCAIGAVVAIIYSARAYRKLQHESDDWQFSKKERRWLRNVMDDED